MLIASSVAGCVPSDSLEEARARIAAGEAAGSIELLRELIEADPDNAELLFVYGRALSLTGQPGLAEWPLRKAMQDPAWHGRAAIQVARSALMGGNFDSAAQLLGEILERNPDDLEVRLMRANAFAASPRSLEEALEEVDRILEIAPDEVRAYQPRILAYLSLDRPEEAERAIEDLGARIDELDGDDGLRGWHCATAAIFADESGDEPRAAERWAACEQKFPAHRNVVEQSLEFHAARGETRRSRCFRTSLSG